MSCRLGHKVCRVLSMARGGSRQLPQFRYESWIYTYMDLDLDPGAHLEIRIRRASCWPRGSHSSWPTAEVWVAVKGRVFSRVTDMSSNQSNQLIISIPRTCTL